MVSESEEFSIVNVWKNTIVYNCSTRDDCVVQMSIDSDKSGFEDDINSIGHPNAASYCFSDLEYLEANRNLLPHPEYVKHYCFRVFSSTIT